MSADADADVLATLWTNRERAEVFEALDNGDLYIATVRAKSTPKDVTTGARPATFGQRKQRGRNWTRRAGT